MAPLRGWGARGKRLKGYAPHGRWRTMTFLAALRCDSLTAPCVIDGPINGQKFLAYVEHFLVPTLRPGDIVILDNLGSHKAKAVRRAIRAAGAKLLFLPPYSPDLNPIEMAFPSSRPTSKVKPHAPSTTSGLPSLAPQTSLPPQSAQTTSLRQDTNPSDRKML